MRNSLGSFDKPQSLKLLRNFEPSVMSERRSGRCLYRAPDLSRAETTPPQQAGAPVRASRQGGGRFGRQLLAPRSGPYQLLHPRQSWNCVSVPPSCNDSWHFETTKLVLVSN